MTQSMMKASLALASVVGASALISTSDGHGAGGFLEKSSRSSMHPDAAAELLARVEDEWVAQATSFLDCSQSAEAGLNCAIPGKAFAKSCGTLATALVKGSDGDREHVAEYGGRVCKEPAVSGASRHSRCERFAALVAQGMGADSYVNRETFDGTSLCSVFWQNVVDEEKAAIEQRQKAEEKSRAEQQKADDEAAKKRKAEEDARVAEEDARIAAAAKRAEEASKAEKEAVAVAKRVEASAHNASQAPAVPVPKPELKPVAPKLKPESETKPMGNSSIAAPKLEVKLAAVVPKGNSSSSEPKSKPTPVF